MNRTLKLSAVICTAMLAACSSTPDTKPVQSSISTPTGTISSIPDWFMKPPCDANRAVCGVASAWSGDLQMSIDKATLDAKYYVADQLRGKMSAKLKRFVEESGNAQTPMLSQETSKVISNLFVDVNSRP